MSLPRMKMTMLIAMLKTIIDAGKKGNNLNEAIPNMKEMVLASISDLRYWNLLIEPLQL